MHSDDYEYKKARKPRWDAGFPYFPGRIRNIMWWSWRELNPRPKLLHRRHYMLSPIFTFAGQLRMDTLLTD